ncbi:hypothetical protein N6393_004354 [Vibrio vulnificus]|nr:hypothetical protein [Vibrio vulnificus]
MNLQSKIDKYVQSSFVGKEKVIFLDLCHWYRLLDESEYSDLKDFLEHGVKNNEFICPINYSILCEFRKNQDKELVLKRIDFADRLSKRLSFVHHHRVQKMEFFHFGLFKKPLMRKDIFTHWLDFYPVPIRVEQNGASDRTYEALLSGMIDISPVEWSKYDELWGITDGMTKDLFGPLASQINGLPNNVKRSEIVYEELQKIIVDFLDSLSRDMTVSVPDIERIARNHYLNLGNSKSVNKFFKNIPTIYMRSQINASLRIDKSTVKPNDLWDFEHATSLPYTDIYVTDKPSAHILKNVLKLNEKYDVEIISSLEELNQLVRV